MSLTQRNQEIIEIVNNIIKNKGYEGRIYLEPIETTTKKRPSYGKYKDGTLRFTIHMWDVNKIEDRSELIKDLDKRVDDAIIYFVNERLL
ncbi:hypothetical protein [Clostridium sp. YIM B02506]|uniref:hypothetical protein n=1 Tax=Clostridium sp. YIM B02506 TaxID=2910680 RepID=UPI001EEE6C2E|nr:hypothetical protein [Clostridium sp. YIM B02506]